MNKITYFVFKLITFIGGIFAFKFIFEEDVILGTPINLGLISAILFYGMGYWHSGIDRILCSKDKKEVNKR